MGEGEIAFHRADAVGLRQVGIGPIGRDGIREQIERAVSIEDHITIGSVRSE